MAAPLTEDRVKTLIDEYFQSLAQSANKRFRDLEDAGALQGDEYVAVTDNPTGTPLSKRTTTKAIGDLGGGTPSNANPQPTGPPAPGSSSAVSREDHVHAAPWASISGVPDRVGKFSANDEAKLDSLDPSRQLPLLPAAGSRDGKSPVFDGDALAWEIASEGTIGPVSLKILNTVSVVASSRAYTVDLTSVPTDGAIVASISAEALQASNSQRSESYVMSIADLQGGRKWALGGIAGGFLKLTLNAARTSLQVDLTNINATSARPLVLTLYGILGAIGPRGAVGPGAGELVTVKTVPVSGDLSLTIDDLGENEVFELRMQLQSPGGSGSVRVEPLLGASTTPANVTHSLDTGVVRNLSASSPVTIWAIWHSGSAGDVTIPISSVVSGSLTGNIAVSLVRSNESGRPISLDSVTTALGLPAVDTDNRNQLIVRRNDEQGYSYLGRDAVGWIANKTEAAKKLVASAKGSDFAVDEAGDRVILTSPSTDDPWPTPNKFDSLDQVELPTDTDIMAVETAEGLKKIGISDLGLKLTEGLLDHVRIIEHGSRTSFAAPPSGWTWDVENHLTGNNQRDPRHISLAATGGATPDTALAWWARVFQGGTALIRQTSDSSSEGLSVICDRPARGIKQGEVFYLFDLFLAAPGFEITAKTGIPTAQLPIEFNYLEADTSILADTLDIEGAAIEQAAPNVAKVIIDAGQNLTAGDGIVISPNEQISVRPPPYLGGFWGNAQEGEPDIEVLRRRDLIVEDERQSGSVDITWSNGWTIRGLHVPINGIGMLNDQSETLSPAPGSSLQGNVPAGDGAWSFTGGNTGHLVWNGRWPEHGMDLKIAIDMSDFQAGDRIHLTLDTNNNNLWGSARTPDRGVDFHGAGDSVRHTHTHIYELRPTSMTDGTTIEIHLEAIKEGNPSSSVPVGLFRAGYVTLTYSPENPTVPHQVLTLGNPVKNTSIDAIGSDAWLIPVSWSTDNTKVNHLDVDSGDSVWEFTRDLRNVLMELLSHTDTTQAAWTFEVWTYIEGVLDWHRVRSYQMPGPTSGTSAAKPAVHIYFDSNAVLDGQQFVLVGRGLTGSPSAAAAGAMTLDLDTNPDTRFPATAVLAKGLITTEQITGAENSRNSGQRTWPAPKTPVNRWEQLVVLVRDGNGAQHQATFDVSGFRRLDETAQMNTAVFSQPQLGANQELSRNANGVLTYDSGNASVQIIEAWLNIER